MPEGHTLHRLARDLSSAFGGRAVAVSSPQGRFADEAALLVNFRYAPDRDEDAAEAHVREVFAGAVAEGATITIVDHSGGA